MKLPLFPTILSMVLLTIAVALTGLFVPDNNIQAHGGDNTALGGGEQ